MSSSHTEGVRQVFVGADIHADVAVVIVTYNSSADIPSLVDDLREAARGTRLRVVVVDNQSADATVDVVRAHTDVTMIEAHGNLGYAGGINAALPFTAPCDAVLILNPDLRLEPGAVQHMREALRDGIGATVPLMLDENGETYISLRREPSVTRTIGDAFFGSRAWRNRPGFLCELEYRPESYLEARDVDWATGAAIMMSAAAVRAVGEWNEEFFLYSEETDYLRRIRDSGLRIRFEPSAVVRHRRGGSGTSPELGTLMAVSRIRYAERHHRKAYAAAFRAAAALAEALRSYDPDHRHTLAVILNRRRWRQLPRATRQTMAQPLWGPHQRGAVIVPAYNEAAVIKRTLAPLSAAAVDGFIELIVVCNGCTDDTADVARGVEGAVVLELEQGSKPAALNAGDAAATWWPRLYLDSDIQISAAAVLHVLDRLRQGDVLVARPESIYDSDGASALVASYYRARRRIPGHKLAMWGAGVYGLNAEGHQRLGGTFPTVTGDDLYVDTRFDADEKAVVSTEPSVVSTPVDIRSLLAILRRNHRGDAELWREEGQGPHKRVRNSGLDTAVAVVRTVRGLRSAVDAAMYLGISLAARTQFRTTRTWERDESSRFPR